MEHLLSKECIFYNPKTSKCHFIGYCEKLARECPAVERIVAVWKDAPIEDNVQDGE